jgi:cell wall-associated NlpC family hydrolase
MPVSGLAVAYTALGGVILWSGIKGETLSQTIEDLASGKAPTTNQQQIGTPSLGIGTGSDSGSGSSGSGSVVADSGGGDSNVASDALKYVGHCYSYGGAPGTSGTGCWDCSSFCNWVLGHDLGMAIPGYGYGQYDGSVHGPTTLSYLVWSGAKTIGNNPASAQAGDLCVWQTHMGIATGNSNMVSALDESLGTLETTISGGAPTGELLLIRRII